MNARRRNLVRDAEFFGIRDIVLVGPDRTFANDIGASRWMRILRFRTPETAIAGLRDRGMVIVALETDAVPMEDISIDLRRPIAIVIGHERDGVSREFLDAADAVATLPGATPHAVRSLNAAVAAGIAIHHFTTVRAALHPSAPYVLHQLEGTAS